MGNKKQKQKEGGGDVTPTSVVGVPNRDVMQRMNFLWQASVYLGGVEVKREEKVVPGTTGRTTVKKERRKGKTADVRDLARMYVRTMKTVGQKTTVKMDPGVKRTLCRGCESVLVPGISVRVRVRSSREHGHWMVYTCLECGTSRRIPAPGTNVDNDHDNAPDGTIANASASLMDNEVEAGDSVRALSGQVEEEKKSGMGQDIAKVQHEGREKNGGKSGKRSLKTKKRGGKGGAHVPPLFARRSGGHVVFRGGEVVDMEGVYCV